MKIFEKIIIPKDNVNDSEVMIKSIYVKQNEEVVRGTLLLDYETSKANFEILSKSKGFVNLKCKENEYINVGDVIMEVYDKPIESNIQINKNEVSTKKQSISKKAQLLINQKKIDISIFSHLEIITEKNVQKYINESNLKVDSNELRVSPSKITEITNLSNVKRLGLVSSVSKSFSSKSIDTNTLYKNNEFKGSINILLIKVVSELLKSEEFKILNSEFKSSKVILKKHINFGIALNFGSGLKIGVIKKSNKLSISDLESDLIKLIDKYIDNKLMAEDMENPTVVLTDLSDQKIDNFKPLIFHKNSVMIGLAGTKENIQNIIVSFDHRVTDGLVISRFINAIIIKLQTDFPGLISSDSCFKCLKSLEEDKDLDSPGFLKLINHDKEDVLICRNCWRGY